MTVLAYSPVLPSVELFGAYEGIASATAVNQTVSITFTPTEGTLFVVPYEIDTISQLQLEVGPTPSSYIPTPSSGGTATRGAETLTVAAADLPWPTPRVIGPELVTNGGFYSDSDWTKGTGWTISGGQASHVAGSATLLYQPISLTLGKVYKATCDVVSVSGGSGSLQFRSGGTTTSVTITGSQVGTTVEVLYVAEGNTQIAVFAGSGTNMTIDNISVREIDPLSVSIQMDGRMTYADENADGQIIQLLWAAASNTRIRNAVSTNTGSGRQDFQQANAGVYDNVLADADYYSPGVLVPYNIASRHGSTFINGAVDGTALTADTTPVALADLSATDLNLAFDYMGTIRTFRMWNKDIQDSGLEDATS